MTPMKVVVAYNDDAHLKGHLNPTEMIGELEVIETAHEVIDTLTGDHHCSLLPVSGSLAEATSSLIGLRPDVVINLCEVAFGKTRFETNMSLLFDMLGLAHTGCEALASRICQDKALLKELLVDAGIPTPAGFAYHRTMSDAEFMERFEGKLGTSRAIVKPSREDAGLGIERGSVVPSASSAIALLERGRSGAAAAWRGGLLGESCIRGENRRVGGEMGQRLCRRPGYSQSHSG